MTDLREKYYLKKDHHVDARCICGVPQALPSDVYLIKKVRCHNRQIHKFTTLKEENLIKLKPLWD